MYAHRNERKSRNAEANVVFTFQTSIQNVNSSNKLAFDKPRLQIQMRYVSILLEILATANYGGGMNSQRAERFWYIQIKTENSAP